MFETQVAVGSPSKLNPSLADYDRTPTIWKTVLTTEDREDAHRKLLQTRERDGWPVVRVRNGKVTETIQQRISKPDKKGKKRTRRAA